MNSNVTATMSVLSHLGTDEELDEDVKVDAEGSKEILYRDVTL